MHSTYDVSERPLSGKEETGVNQGVSASSTPNLVQNSGSSKKSSVFDFSPEYRAWRDRNTIAGIKYYGRYGVYDGPRLTKLADFVDACKVPIFVFSFLFISGITFMGSGLMVGIGALGLFLFSLVYLLILLLNPPA